MVDELQGPELTAENGSFEALQTVSTAERHDLLPQIISGLRSVGRVALHPIEGPRQFFHELFNGFGDI